MSNKRSTYCGGKCNQSWAFRHRVLIDDGDKRKGKGVGKEAITQRQLRV